MLKVDITEFVDLTTLENVVILLNIIKEKIHSEDKSIVADDIYLNVSFGGTVDVFVNTKNEDQIAHAIEDACAVYVKEHDQTRQYAIGNLIKRNSKVVNNG